MNTKASDVRDGIRTGQVLQDSVEPIVIGGTMLLMRHEVEAAPWPDLMRAKIENLTNSFRESIEDAIKERGWTPGGGSC